MRNARDVIADALVAQLTTAMFSRPVNGAATWKIVSRKLRTFEEISPTQRPALFVAQHDEVTSYQSENLPTKTTIGFNLFVYVNGKASTTPASDLNVILDAIDAALAPDYTGALTLGGLVSHCRREGRTLVDPGDLDGDGFLWIPIRIFGP